ncbi:YciI family protein [Acaryochloris marina]|uniref:YciI family protein n=1 Tax=Acaryochloris marina TaxID=155978 RepID=UPI001BB075D9|nr:YciI family protein [Acaryochloris marina]QUY41893.1 GTP cyclohydrolase [Acaryochloris marina S15]
MRAHLILLTYIKPLEEVDRIVKRHFDYLRENYRTQTFLLSGRKWPRTGGVILAVGKSFDDIEEIARQDPFCIAGVAEYEIIEFELGSWLPELNSILGVNANV